MAGKVPVAFFEANDLIVGELEAYPGQWLVLECAGGPSVGLCLSGDMRRALLAVLADGDDLAAAAAASGLVH